MDVDLSPIVTEQNTVLTAMSAFHATRSYAYILTRSLALIGYPTLAVSEGTRPGGPAAALRVDPDIIQIVADLWRNAFVEPLEVAVVTGDVTYLPDARSWLQRGRDTVRLLLDAAAQPHATMPLALDDLYRDAQATTVTRANAALAACRGYTTRLAASSEVILLSRHQIDVPACQELSKLRGSALFLRPLVIHEPLPPLPDIFQKFLVDTPLRTVAVAPSRGGLRFAWPDAISRVARAIVGRAHAQAIDVIVRPPSERPRVVVPREVGMDPRRLAGKRFVVQTYLQADGRSYSAADLAIDLRFLSEMVR